MKMRRVVVIGLVALASVAAACDASTGNYLGQEPPGLTPVPFAPGILTAVSYAGTFSPDLTEFWFTEQGSRSGATETIGYTLVDEVWSRAAATPFPSTGMTFEPHIAPSGNQMFFTAGTAAAWTAYVSQRTATGWAPAMPLPTPVNSQGYMPMYLSSTLDRTLYWTLVIDGNGVIVRTKPAAGATGEPGGYGPVEYMASDGVPWVGAHPFVAPDESYVIFDVRPVANPRWPSDLVVAFRRPDGTWTPPQPITAVNGSATNEMCASVSPDGQYLFFARNMHIWWVDAAVLDPLRP
ncbi:MAG: hypothetical protein ABFD77_03835 [Thermotogota bacterium]